MSTMRAYERFSGRAIHYAKYRPSYPPEVLRHLATRIDLSPGRQVADIGAGTGIFTELLLKQHLQVTAVEPNWQMLTVARLGLSNVAGFSALAGTADGTTLPNNSVDVIFCAQAFHWFNTAATRMEWCRILRPKGTAVLIWNNLDLNYAFEREYAAILQETSVDGGITAQAALPVQSDNVIFGNEPAERAVFASQQVLDCFGLIGRSQSLSYAPKLGDPRFVDLLARLETLFQEHQIAGQVTLRYNTVLLFGPIISS
jgi:SAM-dependent methyltransferase